MKNYNIALIAALLASSLALTACATKQDRRGPPQDGQQRGGDGQRPGKSSGTFMAPIGALFISMDANGDKRTSAAEMRAGTQSEWAGFSQNPSAISFSDWSFDALGSTDAMPTFMSFDRDFSGVISETEFADQIERDFNRMDKDKDGHVTRSEMLIAFAGPRGETSGRSEKGGRGERGGRGGGQGGGQGGGRPQR